MATTETRLVWLDLEMTGLDPERCVILDLAIIITDEKLEPLAELERTVWQPERALLEMDPFVREMHTKNGLLERVRKSPNGLADVERDVMKLMTQHCKYGEGILAGNSIYQDRRFITRYMSQFERYLHYRQVDVSSLKVLAQSWFPGRVVFAKPTSDHTALADVRASIAELKYYRENLLAK